MTTPSQLWGDVFFFFFILFFFDLVDEVIDASEASLAASDAARASADSLFEDAVDDQLDNSSYEALAAAACSAILAQANL